MHRKDELTQARQYFREHPGTVKYKNTESGFSSSYLIDRTTGRITRLSHKAELDYIRGAGGFGKVKKSESDAQETAMKIQVRPLNEDFLDDSKEDLEQEAKNNLDFGIAKGPLIERIDREKKRVKYYQEMYPLKQTLKSKIPELDMQERIKTAIDFLLLIEDCHTGELTQSRDGYMHGDLSTDNVMYDYQGKMRLIDFAFSSKLTDTNQLRDDYKDAMRTIYHEPLEMEEKTASIFDSSQFHSFPIHLQKTLAWQKYLRPNVAPEQNIIFITAVLIAYQNNPHLSEADIDNLKVDTYAQTMLVEQYKRKEAILQIPDIQAQKTFNDMLRTLERYQHFLNRKCTTATNVSDEAILWHQKRDIITNLVHSISETREQSPQESLAKIDRVLLENDAVFSQNTHGRMTGVLGYIKSKIPSFSGDISADELIDKIDRKINSSSHSYRTALKEQRDRSDTESSSLSSGSSKEDSAKSPSKK